MLTKRELCECIVDTQCQKLHCTRKEAHNAIFQSSLLAVALDYLGELSPMESEYAQGRAGSLYQYRHFNKATSELDGVSFLTLRELIELLPDEYDHTEDMW